MYISAELAPRGAGRTSAVRTADCLRRRVQSGDARSDPLRAVGACRTSHSTIHSTRSFLRPPASPLVLQSHDLSRSHPDRHEWADLSRLTGAQRSKRVSFKRTKIRYKTMSMRTSAWVMRYSSLGIRLKPLRPARPSAPLGRERGATPGAGHGAGDSAHAGGHALR